MTITIVLACPHPSRACFGHFFTSRACAYYTWSYEVMRYWEIHVDFQLKKKKSWVWHIYVLHDYRECSWCPCGQTGLETRLVWVKDTLFIRKVLQGSSLVWLAFPRPDACWHPPETSAGFFQSYLLSVNGKLFLSKNMQNTLEGNCKTFRIQETYFDDF